MKKAINAWSVGASTGFEDMFRQVSEAGFDGIELNIDAEGHSAHSLSMKTNVADAAMIQALAERYSLPVISISTSLYGGKMGSPDSAEREFAKDLLKKQLELAGMLGADGILAVPGGNLLEGVSLQQAYDNSQRTISEVLDDINACKVKVGLENVWNGFFMSPFDMCSLIDSLDCAYVGAYFDVGNVIAFSCPEYWIEVLGKRIFKIHVKDFLRSNGFNLGGEWVDLLAGSVAWEKVVPALKNAGFDQYLTAEVEPTKAYSNRTEFYADISVQLDEIIAK